MSIFITILKYVGLIILVLLAIGLIYQYVATKLDKRKYPPIGTMVDIGGYKLHMIDQGTGGPTVVIDSGDASFSIDWILVQPEIAKFTRVISYDRAGLGFSDISTLKRTSENMVKELHTMLHNAHIPAPYILVGHSFGGNNVRLFASMYPEEVSGIVLVDSSHEDMCKKFNITIPFPLLLKGAFYTGLARLFFFIKAKTTNTKTKFPLATLQIGRSLKSTNKFIQTVLQQRDCMELSCDQLKSAQGGLLGNKPLTVITAGKQLQVDERLGKLSQDQIMFAEMQTDLVTKSSRGKQIIAENSGHNIMCDQPEIIVEAVREMIDELNKRK